MLCLAVQFQYDDCTVAITRVKDNAIAFSAVDRATVVLNYCIGGLAADAAIDFIFKE